MFDTAEIDDPLNPKPAFVGERLLSERLPEAQNAAAPDALLANIQSACARGLPQIPCLQAHDLELVICAGGPSLKRALPEIGKRARRGANVIAINKASEYLFENGVIGNSAVVLLDPQPVLADQFAADHRSTYFVASQCHPSVFDRLAGHEVLIWHAQDTGPELDAIRRFYSDPVIIGGGTTAALRTIGIGHAMGFRKMHIYGLDGSFEAGDDGNLAHHAYVQTEDDVPEIIEIIARDGGEERRFWTRQDYARQAEEFMGVLHTYHTAWKLGKAERLHAFVHGDGLIPHIWRKRRNELV